jgi:hypothetical protein
MVLLMTEVVRLRSSSRKRGVDLCIVRIMFVEGIK